MQCQKQFDIYSSTFCPSYCLWNVRELYLYLMDISLRNSLHLKLSMQVSKQFVNNKTGSVFTTSSDLVYRLQHLKSSDHKLSGISARLPHICKLLYVCMDSVIKFNFQICRFLKDDQTDCCQPRQCDKSAGEYVVKQETVRAEASICRSQRLPDAI